MCFAHPDNYFYRIGVVFKEYPYSLFDVLFYRHDELEKRKNIRISCFSFSVF